MAEELYKVLKCGINQKVGAQCVKNLAMNSLLH